MAAPPPALVVALGVIGLALAWALAILLVLAARRFANVALAATFFLIGGALGLYRVGLLANDPFLSLNLMVYATVCNNLIPIAYLLFIGAALETPIARPFRTRIGRALLFTAAVPLALHPFLAPEVYLTWGQTADGAWTVLARNDVGDVLNALTLFTTLAAALTAWWLAPRGTLRRERARMYAIAFGAQDGAIATLFVTLFVIPSSYPWTMDVGVAVASLVAMPLIAYVLLRYHLFDVDLRIKAGLRRSTVAAVFVAAFLVVAAMAEQWLEQYGVVVGGVAVGLLVFALRPIERVAERLANTAMPAVRATPEYLAFRKLDVYRAAVESAHESGGIDAKERATLDRLRAKLGIAQADAAAVEADVDGSAAAA